MSAVTLLFREGARPDVAAIRALGAKSGEFSISLEPDGDVNGGEGRGAEASPGWVELLASGLTFDLGGLAPAEPAVLPPRRQSLGLDIPEECPLEAITLVPGPHLLGGVMMLPVIRTLAWQGAVLSQLDGVVAVCWHRASSWSAPGLYRDGVERWVEGGVFPGLILASLLASPDGGLQSQGMAVFTGQELRIEPEIAADRADLAKLAIRLMDYLIVQGRVTSPDRILGPDGRALRLEPSGNGLFVRVWHG